MEAIRVNFSTRHHSPLDLTDNQWPDLAQRRVRQDNTGVIRPDFDPTITNTFLTSDPILAPWLLFGGLKHISTLALRVALSDMLSESMLDGMAEAKLELI